MTTNVLVDVEAVGPSPITGEMTEFGAVALNHDMTAIDRTFHGVLVKAAPDPERPAVPLIPSNAVRYSKRDVMRRFAAWLNSFEDKVVFVSDNNGFDAMWITCAFDEAGIDNPFGHSSRRISDFYAGMSGKWTKTQQWKSLRRTRHSHHPVDDAMGNAEALIELMSRVRESGE